MGAEEKRMGEINRSDLNLAHLGKKRLEGEWSIRYKAQRPFVSSVRKPI
jgi:hypothetical protein